MLLLLTTAITLNLLRVFEVPAVDRRAFPSDSFGTGALAAFVATPCAGPFLGAALGTALLLPPAGSVAVFAALGFGLALPFLLIAFVPALRRSAPQARTLDGAAAAHPRHPDGADRARLPLAVMAARRRDGLVRSGWSRPPLALDLLLRPGGCSARASQTGYVATLAALAGRGWLAIWPCRSGRRQFRAAVRGAEAWSEARVQRGFEQGKPVFVYFTADWCLTCKANEATAIDRKEVQRRVQGGRREGAWSATGPTAIRTSRASWRAGAAPGVPLYLWYAPGRSRRSCRRS